MAIPLMSYHKSFLLGLQILRFIGLDPTNKTRRTQIISGISCAWIMALAVWVVDGFFAEELTLQIFTKQTQALAATVFVSISHIYSQTL